ncbi:homoserine kinase [Breoghania corrubedonensis]|uniref:Homoserine kinase n=1 Tax=Breoghania corrubedonensis TaxID=665038 RepID=A0A2T5VET2_9HYPH|nr:homoserine kinase [Breoghania corrubedonensis]PTW62248.1 homoserine kinase [Breoghania corrubedonensis]
MAVYTDVTDEELHAFVAQYDIGSVLAFKGIAEGVENSNFLLHTEAGYFILTLYEKRVNPAELPYFIGLMEHLAAAGISCPTPLANLDSETLGTLAGKPAAICTFLNGMSVRRAKAVHCQGLGNAMAEMHLAGADFTMHRKNALTVDGWRPLFDLSQDRADEVCHGLAAEIERELTVLEERWPRDLPVGEIHADLFTDNVFFLGEELSGIIDFYFACTDAFAYDVAICLNAWCFEADDSFNVTKARALLKGYSSVRPFTAAEFEALPLLARGSALRFLLTRLYDWLSVPEGALVTPKDPMEYLKKLRFHRHVTSARDYGLALGDVVA